MGVLSPSAGEITSVALEFCTGAGLCRAGVLAGREEELSSLSIPSGLSYLAASPSVRADITKWFPLARSVLVCSFQYWDASLEARRRPLSKTELEMLEHSRGGRKNRPPEGDGPFEVARYYMFRDYHETVRQRLEMMLAALKNRWPDIEGRAFVDSSPVSEKRLGALCGLGWAGRNGLLVGKGGSWFNLGGLALSCEVDCLPALPANGCGECRACVKACPTGALSGEGINLSRCLAHWLTRKKENPPEEFASLLSGMAGGCDRCQQACPYNARLEGKALEPLSVEY